jgi:hypothetical protein
MLLPTSNASPFSSRLGVITPQEQYSYSLYFRMFDTYHKGVIDAVTASTVMTRSGLDRKTLHDIWALADCNNEGFLSQEAFFVALRLIAHAQSGITSITPELISLPPSMLPTFEGFDPNLPTANITSANITSANIAHSSRNLKKSASQMSLSGLSCVSLGPGTEKTWKLTDKQISKYTQAFKGICENDHVTGTAVAALCKKSNLSNVS